MKSKRPTHAMARRGAARGCCSARNAVLGALAVVLGLPLALIVRRTAQLYTAQAADAGDGAAASLVTSGRTALVEQKDRLSAVVGSLSSGVMRRLRGGGAPRRRPGELAMSATDVIEDGLIGEGVRMELVRADVSDMNHYSALCHATRTVASYTGALANPTVPVPTPLLRFQLYAPDDVKSGAVLPITCAAVNFWMVDQRNEWISDSLIEFVLGSEQWGIELWSSVLTASRCVWYPCATELGPALEAAGKRLVVMDFGSNHGFFGLMAARLGFPVVAVDPQPHCVQYVRMAAAVNGDSARVTGVNAFLAKGGKLPPAGVDSVANKASYIAGRSSVNVAVRSGCWGTWPQEGRGEVEGYYHKLAGGNATVSVPVLDPASLVGPDDVVVLMKIDVEGAEVVIMEGLFPLLDEGRVLNIMMELNKYKFNDTARSWETPRAAIEALYGMLLGVAQRGYVTLCAQYGDNVSWDTSPHIDTPESIRKFVEDGWTSANVWVFKKGAHFDKAPPFPVPLPPPEYAPADGVQPAVEPAQG